MNSEDLKIGKLAKEISSNVSLSDREKHLVGLAVTLTRGCTPCSSRRFKEAFESGISHKDLVDLTDLVSITNAAVTARTALTSSEMINLNDICKDDICSV